MGDIKRVEVGKRLSQVAVFNGVAYLAGQVPTDATADVAGQTAQVLAVIDGLLASVGSDKTRILMAQIFLADINDFGGMNQAWEAWVPAGNAPPRATVQALLANPAFKVEIVIQAAVAA